MDKILEAIDLIESVKQTTRDVCIIAGGAVRDSIMGRYINDVDVYTNINLNKSGTKLMFMRTLKRLDNVKHVFDISGSKYSKWSVINVVMKNSNKIEFIHMPGKPIVDVINHYDIGLCKAWLTSDYQLETHPHFDKDRDNQTLTYRPNDLDAGQIIRATQYHIPKIMKKYPEHKLIMSYE